MKTVKAIITVAIVTIASTSFGATKCSQRFGATGNSLFQNTAATSSTVAQTKTASTAAVKGTR